MIVRKRLKERVLSMKGKTNGESVVREDLVQELVALAAQLQELGHYPLLANLSLDHFSRKEQRLPTPLKKMSLEEFSEHVDSQAFLKSRHSVRSLKILKEILLNLVQDSSSVSGEPSVSEDVVLEEFPPDALTTSHETGPTELILQGLIDALRVSPRLTQHEHRRLGEFWEEHWPRAPFEETFTLRQLSQLEAYVLLKKRSVTDKKAHFIHLAVKKALRLCTDNEDLSQEGDEPFENRMATRQDTVLKKEKYANFSKTGQEGDTSTLYGEALSYLLAQQTAEFEGTQGGNVLHILKEHVSADDLEFLLASYRYRAITLASLYDSTEDAIEGRLASCGASLRELCLRKVPYICRFFEAFEIAPLVPLDKVISLCAPDLPQPVARLVMRSILSAFGYHELSYRARSAPGLAIRRGGMLEVKLDAVAAGVEQEASLTQVIPLLEGEALEIFQDLIKQTV
jgi:hypothetical protein